jgi:hypothetical protein
MVERKKKSFYNQNWQMFSRSVRHGFVEAQHVVDALQNLSLENWWGKSTLDERNDRAALMRALRASEHPICWLVSCFFGLSPEENHVMLLQAADAGCSWSQVFYALEMQDVEANMEWLNKAAAQNNPWAIDSLGDRYGNWKDKFPHHVVDEEMAMVCYHRAAELGWYPAMNKLSDFYAEVDLREAIKWAGKEYCITFSKGERFEKFCSQIKGLFQAGGKELQGYSLDQLCYTLGKAQYWDAHKSNRFGLRCCDYYCACVDVQHKSIFTFLIFWNQTARIKELGQMIAQLVWQEREDLVLLRFGEERWVDFVRQWPKWQFALNQIFN